MTNPLTHLTTLLLLFLTTTPLLTLAFALPQQAPPALENQSSNISAPEFPTLRIDIPWTKTHILLHQSLDPSYPLWNNAPLPPFLSNLATVFKANAAFAHTHPASARVPDDFSWNLGPVRSWQWVSRARRVGGGEDTALWTDMLSAVQVLQVNRERFFRQASGYATVEVLVGRMGSGNPEGSPLARAVLWFGDAMKGEGEEGEGDRLEFGDGRESGEGKEVVPMVVE